MSNLNEILGDDSVIEHYESFEAILEQMKHFYYNDGTVLEMSVFDDFMVLLNCYKYVLKNNASERKECLRRIENRRKKQNQK